MGKSNKVKDWDNEYGGDDDDDFNDDKKPMSKTKKAIISCSISVVFLLVLTFGIVGYFCYKTVTTLQWEIVETKLDNIIVQLDTQEFTGDVTIIIDCHAAEGMKLKAGPVEFEATFYGTDDEYVEGAGTVTEIQLGKSPRNFTITSTVSGPLDYFYIAEGLICGEPTLLQLYIQRVKFVGRWIPIGVRSNRVYFI